MWCPNPNCLHRDRTGNPAEYCDGIDVCANCGTDLVAERPDFGEGVDLTRLVPVRYCVHLQEAQLVSEGLRWRGIWADVIDENIVHMNWFLAAAVGWVKVVVREEDVEAAREALRDDWRLDEQAEGVEEGESCYPACPKCQSENVHRLGVSALSIPLILAGVPLLLPRDRFVCDSCGHAWNGSSERQGYEDSSGVE